MPNGTNNGNTTRRNRIRAMTMGQPIRPSALSNAERRLKAYQENRLTGEEVIARAQQQLRKSIEENTEFNTNIGWVPNSIKNLRAGLPEHDIISRAQDRMAAEIAKAEAIGSKDVIFRFPLTIGKKILYALTFLLSILSLPGRFLAQLFGILRAKLSTPSPGFQVRNWGRTPSMIEEGRFGSRANQVVEAL